MTRDCNGELIVRLLDCEIVDGVSEKVLTFSAFPRFRLDNELAVIALLVYVMTRCQSCFVIAETHWVGITVFSLMDYLIVHRLCDARLS